MQAALPSLLNGSASPLSYAVKSSEVEIRSFSPLSTNEFGAEAHVVLHPRRHTQVIGIAADFAHVMGKCRKKIGKVRVGGFDH